MKNVAWLVSLLLLAGMSAGSRAEQGTLRIEISGLDKVAGEIYISVYDNDDAWLGGETVITVPVDIDSARQGAVVVAEVLLAPGEYAASIYYDENGNGELDRSFVGIPKEPVALSNNAKPGFGPPKFEDSLFTLTTEGATQLIAIKLD